jgi:hypothetical protein
MAAREPVYEFDYVGDAAITADVHEAYWQLKQNAPRVLWASVHRGQWVVTAGDAATDVRRYRGGLVRALEALHLKWDPKT